MNNSYGLMRGILYALLFMILFINLGCTAWFLYFATHIVIKLGLTLLLVCNMIVIVGIVKSHST